MNIISGKCVICFGNTLVVSGKDKQKFVELLKEHYFDANQINDNKFLLQFKEKRTEKSICICCAYVIECYVNLRNKFQDHKTKDDKKCSICRIDSNLICGTPNLIKDASTLLKNVHPDNKVRRLTLLCLDCCFSIVSWNKIKDIISQYSENVPMYKIETSKRKYSLDDSNIESTPEDMYPARRSRRMSVISEKMKQYVATNGTIKRKITRTRETQKKKKSKLVIAVEDQLKHLSTVSEEISSEDICLNGKMKRIVESDDRMMFDIAYISCGTNDEAYSNNKSPRVNNKQNKQKKITKSRKRNIQSIENEDAVQSNLPQKNLRMTRTRSKVIRDVSISSSVISISDTESENSNTQRSLRVSKRKKQTHQLSKSIKNKEKRSIIYKTNNECTVCSKQFAKKYKLKLHELEHESSFTPVVLIKKEKMGDDIKNDDVLMNEECNDDNKGQENEEIQNKLDTLVKQVVDDALTQIENEIEKNIVNQVVDDTLSQLENKIQEDKERSVDKENLFATDSKENNETIEIEKEENCTNSDTNVTEINAERNKIQSLVSEEKVFNNKDIEQLSLLSEGVDKINETGNEGSEQENKKLSESDSKINENICNMEDTGIKSSNEISNEQIQDDKKEKENILVSNKSENTDKNDALQTTEVCKDDKIFEEINETSLNNDENNAQINEENYSNLNIKDNEEIDPKLNIKENDPNLNIKDNEENDSNLNIKDNVQNEIATDLTSQDTTETQLLNTEREIEEKILNKLEKEICNENKSKEDNVAIEIEEENTLTDEKNIDRNEIKSNAENVSEVPTKEEQNDSIENKSNKENSENEEINSQNTDRISNSYIIEEDSDMETLQVSPDSIPSPKKKNDLNDNSSPKISSIDDTQNNADKYEIENILQNLGA